MKVEAIAQSFGRLRQDRSDIKPGMRGRLLAQSKVDGAALKRYSTVESTQSCREGKILILLLSHVPDQVLNHSLEGFLLLS